MRRFVCCEDDNTPVLRDGESIDYRLAKVGVAYKDSNPVIEEVQLYVTSSRIILIGETLAADFDVSYITLHAVTRDPASYPKPCLYCQLDFSVDDDDDDEEETEALLFPKSELFLVPENLSDLKDMFDAFSHAALLNPDPPEDGEEEGDDELIYNTAEVTLGVEQARALEHLESVFHLPEDNIEENLPLENFEDAPEN